MNCPMHNLIFRSRGRSYRELPLRLFEFGSVYRYEKSGVVHGLTRVRGMTQDDSHSYVTAAQAPAEIKHLLDFVLSLLRDFGLDDYYLELSTRASEGEKKDKFIGSAEQWEVATDVLRDVATESGLELVLDPGGAAYYGPKISVQARDAIGRTWQMSTIQYDFNQPERFGLEYQASDGTRQQPVMIHSAKFGSIERFFGVLVEHYAGAFPVWLSPVQALGIPVAEEFDDYLRGVLDRMRAARASASSSTPATTASRRRSATRARPRCRTCSSRGRTTAPRGRCRSGTATGRRRTACPSTTRSPRSRPRSPTGARSDPRRRRGGRAQTSHVVPPVGMRQVGSRGVVTGVTRHADDTPVVKDRPGILRQSTCGAPQRRLEITHSTTSVAEGSREGRAPRRTGNRSEPPGDEGGG